MKVRRVVELLYQTYDPEQEIMVAWYGSEGFETKAGVWERAVEMFDAQNSPYQYSDYIRDLVGDAEFEIEQEQETMNELAMDAYLERVREEQANV